jgi:hypothetical protein
MLNLRASFFWCFCILDKSPLAPHPWQKNISDMPFRSRQLETKASSAPAYFGLLLRAHRPAFEGTNQVNLLSRTHHWDAWASVCMSGAHTHSMSGTHTNTHTHSTTHLLISSTEYSGRSRSSLPQFVHQEGRRKKQFQKNKKPGYWFIIRLNNNDRKEGESKRGGREERWFQKDSGEDVLIYVPGRRFISPTYYEIVYNVHRL